MITLFLSASTLAWSIWSAQIAIIAYNSVLFPLVRVYPFWRPGLPNTFNLELWHQGAQIPQLCLWVWWQAICASITLLLDTHSLSIYKGLWFKCWKMALYSCKDSPPCWHYSYAFNSLYHNLIWLAAFRLYDTWYDKWISWRWKHSCSSFAGSWSNAMRHPISMD